MLKKILVPIDGSSLSEAALNVAIPVARRHAATLHAVTAYQPPSNPLRSSGAPVRDPRFDAEIKQQVVESLKRAERRMAADAPELSTNAILLEGRPVEAIAAYVEAQGHDLVVMTTHGRTGVSRMWLGSVADGLVRVCIAPVLLLTELSAASPRDAESLFENVVIPIDTMHESTEIVDAAVTLAGPLARYVLLHVLEPLPFLPRAPLDVVSMLDDAGVTAEAPRSMYEAATETLEQLADRMRRHGYTVSTSVAIHRHPAAAILAQAAELSAPLIAMATRGRGGTSKMLLGSVADKVVRGATVPVLVSAPPRRREARRVHKLAEWSEPPGA